MNRRKLTNGDMYGQNLIEEKLRVKNYVEHVCFIKRGYTTL